MPLPWHGQRIEVAGGPEQVAGCESIHMNTSNETGFEIGAIRYGYGHRHARRVRDWQRLMKLLRRVAVIALTLIALVLIALALRPASAQVFGEPWCQVSPPTLPAGSQINCLQPRVFLPEVQG